MKFTNIKQVEVFTDENKWYLSIVDEIEPPEYQDNGLYQAWDLGITKQTGVNLQGKFTEIKNIRPDKYWQKPITEVQSRRDHCKKGSRKFKFLNGLKRKMERKCRNQIKDFQHKTSLMIVKNTRANTIFIGDLDVKMMAQSKKKDMSTKAKKSLNRSTQGTGYLARFAELLTYKSEKIGKKAIEVSERYTTKKCCQCGKLHYMPVSKRVMICDCGLILDRDRNSSVNIMVEALSQNAMCTGYQQFVDNLRTGSGIIISPGHSQEAPSVRVA
jgi:putative transposase